MPSYDLSELNLFKPKYSIDDVERKPIRPLGEVSDFVVYEMPKRLTAVRKRNEDAEALIDSIESLLFKKNIEQILSDLDTEKKNIVVLDLRMLQSAVMHSNGAFSEKINKFYNSLSDMTMKPNILTYEDLVLNNPKKDIRTFTEGFIGHSEASFYVGHQITEEKLEKVVRDLVSASQLLILEFIDVPAADINKAAESLYGCAKFMGVFAEMKREDYCEFRPYISHHSNLIGPSGRFSPGAAQMDLIFAGKGINYFNELESLVAKGYYQKEKIYLALETAKNGTAIMDSNLVSDNGGLRQSVKNFAQAVIDFRRQHYHIAHKQVPDVVENKVRGTSGEVNSGSFMKDRMKIYHEIVKDG